MPWDHSPSETGRDRDEKDSPSERSLFLVAVTTEMLAQAFQALQRSPVGKHDALNHRIIEHIRCVETSSKDPRSDTDIPSYDGPFRSKSLVVSKRDLGIDELGFRMCCDLGISQMNDHPCGGTFWCQL